MRIVLEGADLVGKSTIAKELSKALDLPLRAGIHRVGPERIREEQEKDFKQHPNAILDRCYWMTDVVYEPIVHKQASVFTVEEQMKFLLEDDNTAYVIIWTPNSVLKRRWYLRGDELQSWDTIKKANLEYTSFGAPNTLLFNSSTYSVQHNAKLLIEYLKNLYKKEN